MLLAASDQTGDPRYEERAAVLMRDWIEENPRDAGRSPFSWNDHGTAWRATVLVCVAQKLGRQPWLETALEVHGETLASSDFYVRAGNHALNQNIALLDVVCHGARDDWTRLASARLGDLAASSIDVEGVTNEQAVFYQLYNWRNYVRARDRLTSCGLEPPDSFERVDRMVDFLAHATLPNGEYTRLGDTARRRADATPGTTAEFAASLGERGSSPSARFATYKAGFTFGRSGWGETRPFADEIAWSVRHGPGRAFHGHGDHTAVTLYGFGTSLLEDSGVFTFNSDAWRDYALSHAAHNVVTVDGIEYHNGHASTLDRATTSSTVDEVVVRDAGYAGVETVRRVVFSPGLGYLVVEDRLAGKTERTFRQLWHLAADGDPIEVSRGVRTRRPGANVEIVQLLDVEPAQIVMGREDPIQGWLSENIQHRGPAPVAEFTVSGTSARFLTVIVPSPSAAADIAITDLEVAPGGFSFRIAIDGRAERVVATADGVTITPG